VDAPATPRTASNRIDVATRRRVRTTAACRLFPLGEALPFTTGSPARIGLIRMRGAASQLVRASEELDVTTTAISKTIKQLEAQLDVRLFNRTTRSVALTEAGTKLLGTLAPALAQIRDSAASGRFLRAPTWPAAHQHRVRRVRYFDSGAPRLVRRAPPGDHVRYHDRQQSLVQVMFDLMLSSIGHIRAGKLRIAVTTSTR
jgi:DNA-binding transcriptional LysR family regulator